MLLRKACRGSTTIASAHTDNLGTKHWVPHNGCCRLSISYAVGRWNSMHMSNMLNNLDARRVQYSTKHIQAAMSTQHIQAAMLMAKKLD